MSDFIAFSLHGRNLRYYSVDRIDREFRGKADDWRPVSMCNCGIYKKFSFVVDKKMIAMLLHRVVYFVHNPNWNIYDGSRNNQIDHRVHRVGEPLDNSITNLRVVSNQQNAFNTNAKGYCFNKKRNKYQAQIGVNGKQTYIGSYETAEQARNAYLELKKSYHII